VSPLSSRALHGQAPRRSYVVATQPMAWPAQALKARRCAQDVEWQGQPGIEPGRTLAESAGLLACASKHNGLLRPSVASRSLRSLGVHTAAAKALRPSGWHNPRYVLRPSAPARGTSLQLVPRPIPKHVLAMASPSPQRTTARRLRAVLKVGPARPPSAPEGLPSVLPPPRELPPLAGQRSAVLSASRVRFAGRKRPPLTRLRAALGEVGQRRSP
jgi:hypothetical protein